MNFLHFFSRNKIDESVKEAREKTGSILLDVRTPEEYRSGHIPGSRNIPLQNLEQADTVLKDKDAPLYLYCQSGARSSMATALLRSMGFTQVSDMGGISGWHGEIERGGKES